MEVPGKAKKEAAKIQRPTSCLWAYSRLALCCSLSNTCFIELTLTYENCCLKDREHPNEVNVSISGDGAEDVSDVVNALAFRLREEDFEGAGNENDKPEQVGSITVDTIADTDANTANILNFSNCGMDNEAVADDPILNQSMHEIAMSM